MIVTEHEARIVLAIRERIGTSGELAKRAGVNDRAARAILTRLMEARVVERTHSRPMAYYWVGSSPEYLDAVLDTLRRSERARQHA